MFSLSTLTIGDVGVVVRPILSAAQLRETLEAIASIKGIDRVTVERLHGDTAHLGAHAERPVALASELRAAFRQRVVSCTAADGRFTVELAAPGAAAGPTVPDPSDRRAADRPAFDRRTAEGAGRRRPERPAAEPMSGRPVADGPAYGPGRTAGDGPTVPPADRPDPRRSADDPDRLARVAATEAVDGCTDLTVLLFDHDLRFTAAAGGLHRRLGYDIEQIRGRAAKDVLPAGAWAILRPGYTDALAGRSRTVDVPLTTGLGVYEASFRPLIRDGRIVGGMVTARDVTHQRTTERALAETSAVLGAVIDASETPFGLLALNGRWARVNRAMTDLLDEDEASMLSSNLFDRTRPDDTRALEGTLGEMIGDRRDHHLDGLRLRRRHGDWVDVTARLTAVRSVAGLHGVVVELGPAVVIGAAS